MPQLQEALLWLVALHAPDHRAVIVDPFHGRVHQVNVWSHQSEYLFSDITYGVEHVVRGEDYFDWRVVRYQKQVLNALVPAKRSWSRYDIDGNEIEPNGIRDEWNSD